MFVVSCLEAQCSQEIGATHEISRLLQIVPTQFFELLRNILVLAGARQLKAPIGHHQRARISGEDPITLILTFR